MSPAEAVERLRAEAARARIESGADPIEAIAAGTGFGDPEGCGALCKSMARPRKDCGGARAAQSRHQPAGRRVRPSAGKASNARSGFEASREALCIRPQECGI